MTEHEQRAEFELDISPEPTAEEREAILAVVEQTLVREAELARPPAWKLAGWVGQRVGLTDLSDSVGTSRRWPLSAWLPRGGRVFPGLNGRGDAK